jgi:hypothetical protein
MGEYEEINSFKRNLKTVSQGCASGKWHCVGSGDDGTGRCVVAARQPP